MFYCHSLPSFNTALDVAMRVVASITCDNKNGFRILKTTCCMKVTETDTGWEGVGSPQLKI